MLTGMVMHVTDNHDFFGATATSTGRDVIICWILRMLLLTTLPSWSRHGITCFINPRLQGRRFLNARLGEEGQATSPLESFFDSPQLLVSRKCKSIAQQNTPALNITAASGRTAGLEFPAIK